MTAVQSDKAPLAGIRVAELGTGAAVAYCGKLFADFGADVVKVEPPGGDPDRRLPPLVDAGGRQESAVFAWLNTNKQSLTVAADDAARLAEIAGAADVLIDARPGAGWDQGPGGHAALRAAFAHLHIVSISWFGESGPYRDYAATDATVRALAGCVRQVGEAGAAPIVQPQSQAYLPGALSAFSAALAALISDSPRGRKFEISLHEANACEPEFQAAVTVALSAEERRWGLESLLPGLSLRHLSDRRWLAGRDRLLERPVARILRHAGAARGACEPGVRQRADAIHGRRRRRRCRSGRR